ncbi:hypothetical protein B5F40_03160 [Gordonibacter sp. An230]|uniref:hypothetical protein n=1 Tax=Gordonibacter sp. An230 TaxID=1965592 RepID=UPI000B36C915|nr:hypothetical protein [Gordonibacter sp. An230]OUO91451.1 hypothetical protein B5F40_03160 [Gordonibacter sp. An230]
MMAGTAARTDGCCGRNPMGRVRTDEELLEFAGRLSGNVLRDRGDARLAESCRRLLVASAALLRDWFEEESYSPCGMVAVISMGLMRGKYDSDADFMSRSTPLDLLFRQIERGEKYARGEDGEWGWRKTRLRRNYDGARPAETGGMPWGTDVASAFYAAWRASAEPAVLEESIGACIGEVSGLGMRHAA